ncbi:MAG: C4-dicarboxylate ABC transporter permease [Chloroflexi bacterium RBG_16_50_9]|nr:MAG: C4-dicarboxylate ABC transporter permease [Chloroflexi bacterium RBG_16_50_9]
MSPVEIGILGLLGLFILMFLGMPIGLSMGLVAFSGLMALTSPEAALLRLGSASLGITMSYSVAVLPLYMLMGEFAHMAGLTHDAYDFANKWLGRLPGGLAMATIAGCAGFAAVCGSSIATTTTMASVALPEMRKYKYAPSLCTGSIAAGGTLGILIPPSSAFALYGIITEQSIGKLFIAGILPGILLSFLFMLTIFILAKFNPLLGPPGSSISWQKGLSTLKNTWGVLILFLVVMGGIYTGVFTATEAAAIGVFCAFVITVVKRRINMRNIMNPFRNIFVSAGMVFLILIGAILFGYFLAQSRLTLMLADFVAGLPLPPSAILVAILLLFLILGCVMDTYAMLMIVVPILFPVILRLGIDPIMFGVLTVLMMEMGMITPPVGMNVFIMAGVAKDVPMYTVFRGVIPFIIAMAVCIAILVTFPQIILFLPNAMR